MYSIQDIFDHRNGTSESGSNFADLEAIVFEFHNLGVIILSGQMTRISRMGAKTVMFPDILTLASPRAKKQPVSRSRMFAESDLICQSRK